VHDLHHELLRRPGRSRFTSVSLAANEFDEQCEDDFGLRLLRLCWGERFEEPQGEK
jgi:hypothetical protein